MQLELENNKMKSEMQQVINTNDLQYRISTKNNTIIENAQQQKVNESNWVNEEMCTQQQYKIKSMLDDYETDRELRDLNNQMLYIKDENYLRLRSLEAIGDLYKSMKIKELKIVNLNKDDQLAGALSKVLQIQKELV